MRIVSLCILAVMGAMLIIPLPKNSYAASSGTDEIVSEKTDRVHRYHFKGAKTGCEICHGNGQSRDFKLHTKESDACYQCHPKVDDARWAHGPVGVGQCSVCHDPHGSESSNFLVRKREKLCTYCHEENGLQKHIAAVHSNDCTSCHDPHSSENNSLLRR